MAYLPGNCGGLTPTAPRGPPNMGGGWNIGAGGADTTGRPGRPSGGGWWTAAAAAAACWAAAAIMKGLAAAATGTGGAATTGGCGGAAIAAGFAPPMAAMGAAAAAAAACCCCCCCCCAALGLYLGSRARVSTCKGRVGNAKMRTDSVTVPLVTEVLLFPLFAR